MKRHSAVAAGHPLTAETAAEVLRSGGNAVDAAVAGALMACVVEPVLASLLGGGFLMVREASGKTGILDFFVQTPRQKRRESEIDLREIEADFGEVTQRFHIGAATIAVPGVARGLFAAHARQGRMPFAELTAPAVQAARNGVAISTLQAMVLDVVTPIFTSSPGALRIFGDGERLLKAGETYRNPALADVIDTFAREGDRFIHEGEVAQALLSLDGGHLSALDLKRYTPIDRRPLVERRGQARLYLNPPPSLGGALIAFALRLMERGASQTDIAHAFHATTRARIEAGLNDDSFLGTGRLLSGDLIARYRRQVAGRAAATRGTTHISVVDHTGMGAALTLSNGEGCGLIALGTGLMPNNMLGEEDLVGEAITEWTPDTRLSSMMAPMTIDWPDGRVVMLGSGGSNRIRTALALVSAYLIDRDMRLEDAIAAPRVHVEAPVRKGEQPKVDFEDRLREDHRADLLCAFPEAQAWPGDSFFFGGVHAVARAARGGVEAAGDHRRDAAAVVI
ncbi:MAG: gamma-glutamyltransferase [Pseudomonadota bacterium]